MNSLSETRILGLHPKRRRTTPHLHMGVQPDPGRKSSRHLDYFDKGKAGRALRRNMLETKAACLLSPVFLAGASERGKRVAGGIFLLG